MSSDAPSSVVAMPDPENLDPVEAAAAQWVIKLDAGRLTIEERRAFREWLQADEAHRAALRRWNAEWSRADVLLNKAARFAAPAMDKDETRDRRTAPRAIRFAAIAATALAALFSAFLFFPDGRSPERQDAVVYATQVGAQRTVTLTDGSTVQINTNSVIEVEFTDDKRAVAVLDGEVFFDVAHDAARPFYVNARDAVIKVVGTAFAVRAVNDEVVVTVKRGRVELVGSYDGELAGSGARAIELRPSEKAVIQKDAAPIVDHIDETRLERELAWQTGYIVFDEQPLGDVIAEVSRYTDVRIQFSDPSIRDMRVRGRFEIGAIDSLFESLEMSFGVRVTQIEGAEGKVIYLSRRLG